MSAPGDAKGKVRSAVVLLSAGKVALIERERDGRRYYLFPGGGVEAAETTEDAAEREALEELGLAVQIGRLVAVSDVAGREQHFYLASVVGGEFGTGNGIELASNSDSKEGSYTPVWMSIADLRYHDVRPRSLSDLVSAGEIENLSEVLDVKD